ncbi:adenylate/guanylate cyclase domain-containing protein [Microvirga sp. CF3016]|uniref:adenylate/guanylate cyclase domain-containing protein n=1 Tax=Microvirga sp. CF3016 TaxID=3110181 RepID=UPI002E7A8811|nr:adenylate/guanylate cyclase domain-containing protein [Microvirga sp. CF3016]MEE1610401.1 adenylate/guanylate cyclase domain-containing protein [Microvirga sp. CF3016]
MPIDTHYARSGDLRIAYQVIGQGPLDLVFVPGFISNLDLYWDEPNMAHFLSRLGAFSRLILFDKRGTGLSDRLGHLPTLEERMDDVRAVMDAVGSSRAALFGISEGGAMSMLFAATYPERTHALILYGTYADFHTWVLPPDRFETFLERIDQTWGQGESLSTFAPSRMADERFKRWWARFERMGASPSAVITLMRMNSQIDVRHILPAIRVPTLVLHRSGDTRVNVEGGRYLAANIPGASYVEFPGRDHVMWAGDVNPLVDAIEQFLTGTHGESEPDRVLATVLLTDIVDSTRIAEAMGDRRWHALLGEHDRIAREAIDRFRGREVKTLGDGFLATFDGPARAVRCASAIIDALRPLSLDVRCGVHTGEIEMKGDDIGGIAVHIAARIASRANGGDVLVSRTVRDLVAGSNLHLEERGNHALKGLSEPMTLYAVADLHQPPVRQRSD